MQLTYLGNSAFAISSNDTTVLIDPYISDNREHELDGDDIVDRFDLDGILVTHAAHDHVGDTARLAIDHDLPVVSDPGTIHLLESNGVDTEQLEEVLWGMSVEIADLSIRVLEARHASVAIDGESFIAGVPLSFLISDGTYTAYHMGDTSLFRDLKLFGDRYEPDVTMVGVGQAYEYRTDPAYDIEKNIRELTSAEAATAAEWTGSPYTIPMHYLPEEREAFIDLFAETNPDQSLVPLDPMDSFDLRDETAS